MPSLLLKKKLRKPKGRALGEGSGVAEEEALEGEVVLVVTAEAVAEAADAEDTVGPDEERRLQREVTEEVVAVVVAAVAVVVKEEAEAGLAVKGIERCRSHTRACMVQLESRTRQHHAATRAFTLPPASFAYELMGNGGHGVDTPAPALTTVNHELEADTSSRRMCSLLTITSMLESIDTVAGHGQCIQDGDVARAKSAPMHQC